MGYETWVFFGSGRADFTSAPLKSQQLSCWKNDPNWMRSTNLKSKAWKSHTQHVRNFSEADCKKVKKKKSKSKTEKKRTVLCGCQTLATLASATENQLLGRRPRAGRKGPGATREFTRRTRPQSNTSLDFAQLKRISYVCLCSLWLRELMRCVLRPFAFVTECPSKELT